MQQRFKDKVVLITGASAGIGAEAARQLAQEGARLALVARRVDRLEALREDLGKLGGEARSYGADVTDRPALDVAVAAVLADFGRIDMVLAAAGFGVTGPIFKLEVDDYRRQFETNFFGVLNTIYATLPALRASRGQLALFGSVAGMIGTPSTSPYNASKFAIIGLGEAIYHDLDELGVSVTLINPGFVKSEIRHVNNRGELTSKPDPVPAWLVVSTEAAVRTILRALYKRQPDVVVTLHGKVFAWCKRLLPRATRWVIRRMSRRKLPQL